MRVSIISPIYKGVQYVPELIRQVEDCKHKVNDDIEIELILSNDYPEEKLEYYHSDYINIITLNSEKNRGIQCARIAGLEVSSGEYVTFLDQDDKIFPEYIKSQLEEICDNDAVVCRCVNEGKLNFNATVVFEKVITKEYMLTKGDPIVSTGSVMIRKSSIPDIWKQNVLKNSGADDYFLWLCMIANDCTFSLNQQIVFEHVVNGMNTSLNTNRMLESEHEMFETIKCLKIFDDEKTNMLHKLEISIKERHIRLLDKFRLMFFTVNNIMVMQENGITLESHLKNNDIHNIAIYGAGYVGSRIYGVLKDSKINVRCFIDQNAEYLYMPIPTYTIDAIPSDLDAILVTLLESADGVAAELKIRYPQIKVLDLQEITSF